jgi:hypothetical protein
MRILRNMMAVWRTIFDRIRFNGPRGAGLFGLGVMALVRGYQFATITDPTKVPEGLSVLSGVIPIAFWGACWMVAGVICIVSAWRVKQELALASLAGMSWLWFFAYVGTAIIATSETGSYMSWINVGLTLMTVLVVRSLAKMQNIDSSKMREIKRDITQVESRTGEDDGQ